MKKKVLALLLSLCLIAEQGQTALAGEVQSISNTVETADNEESLFHVEDGVLTEYSGEEEIVEIPDNLGIVAIGGDAFRSDAASSSNLKRVVIPEGVKEIQSGAFMYCQELEDVTLPSTLEKIADHAFYSCKKLDGLTLPANLDQIGANAFAYCSALTELRFPDALTTIDEGAFYGCSGLLHVELPLGISKIPRECFRICISLTSIEIPDSISEIGENAFFGCKALETVDVGENSILDKIQASAFDGTKWYQDQSSGYLILNDVLFQYKGTDAYTTYQIPFGVSVIAEGVFEGYEHARGFILPESVTSIRKRAFAGCKSMTGITIPASVVDIAQDAFAERNADLVITGEEGSYAQQYAMDHGITFALFPKEFVVEDGVLTSYNGTDEEIVIPENLGITEIGDNAFSGKNIKTIKIPSGVVRIGDRAFYNCSSLQNIELPYGLEDIGDNAFESSGLTRIVLPGTVKQIGAYAFRYCDSLESAVLEEGIPYIAASMFYRCEKLKEISIPNTVERIGYGAFEYCTGLESVTIPKSVKIMEGSAFDECSMLTEVVLGEGLESLGNDAFRNCKSLNEIDLPDSLKTIGSSVFSGCSKLTTIGLPSGMTELGGIFTGLTGITKVEIPQGVTKISDSAFNGCTNLEEVMIPDTVKEIGEDAFRNCGKLKTVELPEGIVKIPDYAFYGSGLENIQIPDSVTEVGWYAFNGCRVLGNVKLSETLKTIGNYAFENCSALQNIELPSGLENLGEGAFRYSGLSKITLPGTVKQISTNVFYDCNSLESVVLEEGIPYIANTMFYGCEKLKEISIPNTVERIGYGAFTYCTGLESVTIPKSVKIMEGSAFAECSMLTEVVLGEGLESLGNDAFRNCKSLNEIDLPDSLKTIGSSVFSGCSKLTTIGLPSGMTELGGIFTGLTGITKVEIPQGVTKISDSAFNGCTNLEEVMIPDTVKEIGEDAFRNCGKLKTVELPEGIVKIPDYAFYGSGLENIQIPDSVTEVGWYAFNGCRVLGNVKLSETLKTIGNYAFENCSALQNIELPSGLENLGEGAFRYSGLSKITLPGTVKQISTNVFYDCNSLESVVLEEGIPYIANTMFYGCEKLKEISIPNTVERIGYGAFWYCTGLQRAIISEGVETAESYAFANCENLLEVVMPRSLTVIADGLFQNSSQVKIKGFKGSKAEDYAAAKGLAFEVIDTKAPVAPQNFEVKKQSGSSVTLSWDASYDSFGEASYLICRDGEEIARTKAHTYKDIGLNAGQTYQYEIIAYNVYNFTSEKSSLMATPSLPQIMQAGLDNGESETGGEYPAVLEALILDQKNLEGMDVRFYYAKEGEEWTDLGAVTETKLETMNRYQVSWPLKELQTGTYRILCAATDEDGNKTEKEMSIHVDRTAPDEIFGFSVFPDVSEISLSWGMAVEMKTERYRIYRRTDGEPEAKLLKEVRGRETLSYQDESVERGVGYWYSISGVDKYGQEGRRSEEVYGALLEDQFAPEVTRIDPENGSYIKGKVDFTIWVSDNEKLKSVKMEISQDEEKTYTSVGEQLCGDVQNAQVVFSLDTKEFQDGKTRIRLTVEDAAGNVSSPFVRTYYIDNIAPKKIESVSAEPTATTILVKWAIPKDDVSYFEVEEKTEENGEFKFIEKVTGTNGVELRKKHPDTTYWYRVRGVDRSGNKGEYSEQIEVRTKADDIHPVITSMDPKEGYVLSSITMTIRAWDDDLVEWIGVQTSYDGADWTLSGGKILETPGQNVETTMELDLKGEKEGIIFVRAIAKDRAGNMSDLGQNAGFVQYYIDRTVPDAPAYVAVTPQAGYIDVEWNIQENTDIDYYEVYRSTDPDTGFEKISSSLKSANYRDVTAKSDTIYYYKIKAVDMAGNFSAFSKSSEGVKRLADTVDPVVEKINPVFGSALGKASRKISVYVTDNIGISSVQLEYQAEEESGFTVLEKKSFSDTYHQTWVNYELPEYLFDKAGGLTVRITAEDTSGNRSEIKEFSFERDNSAPLVSHVQAIQSGAGVSISWESGQEEDLAGYIIYRKAGNDRDFERRGSVAVSLGQGFYEWKDYNLPQEETMVSYRVEAVDRVGNTSRADSAILTWKPEEKKDEQAPQVEFDVTANMEVGVEYAFDASASSDDKGIVSYRWEFGDGMEAASQMAVHKYEETGTYTVRLTLEDAAGNESSLEKKVIVMERSIMGTVQVTVRDDSGNPVSNAPVYFNLGETDQTIRYTGADGVARLLMPVGYHKVGVYQDGYLPAVKQVKAESGTTSLVSLIAVKEDLVEAEFDIRNMTLEEIVAAGIDVADPASQHMMKIRVNVTIGYRTYEVPCYVNGEGSFVQPGIVVYTDSSQKERAIVAVPIIPDDTQGGISPEQSYTPENPPVVGVADIPIEATFLKEFFEVRMYIINNATEEFSLLDNEITLNVPEGLSIVDTKDSEKGATINVDKIEGSSQREFKWILRGDEPGSYDISASYSGTLEQFGVPIKAKFQAQKPIRVYGTEGLRIILDIKEDIVDGAMYYNVGFQNLSREEIYLPNLRIIDDEGVLQAVLLGKCRVNEYGYMENLSDTERLKTLYKGETLYHKYVKYNVTDPETENAYVVNAIKESTEGLDIELAINILSDFDEKDPFEKLKDLSVSEKSSYDYLMTHENYYYWHAAYQNEKDAQEHFGVNLFNYKDAMFKLDSGNHVFEEPVNQVKMNMVTLFAPGFENNREQLEKQAGEQTAALFKEDLVKALKEAGFGMENLAGVQKAQMGQVLMTRGFEDMMQLIGTALTEEQKEVLDSFGKQWIREEKERLLPGSTVLDDTFAQMYAVLIGKRAQMQYLEQLFDAAEEGYSPATVAQAAKELQEAVREHYSMIVQNAKRGTIDAKKENLGQWLNLSFQDTEKLIGRAVNAKESLKLLQLAAYLSFSVAESIEIHNDSYTQTQEEQEAVLTMALLGQLADLRYTGETIFRKYVSFLNESNVLDRSNTENGTNFADFDQWYENAIQILNSRRQQLLQSGGGLAALPQTPKVTIDYENACTVEIFDTTYEYSVNNETWKTCENDVIRLTPSSFTQTLRVRKKASAQGFAGNIGSAVIEGKERIFRNLEVRWSKEGYEVLNLLPGKTYQYVEADSQNVTEVDWQNANTMTAKEGTNLFPSEEFHPYLWMRIVPDEGALGFPSDTESYFVLGLRKIEVEIQGKGKVTGQGEYEYGEKVTLTAAEEEGYHFVGWFLGNQLLSSNREYEFEAAENLLLTAKFEELKQVQVTLSLEQPDAGVLAGDGIYREGDTVTVIAGEKFGKGYRFKGWKDDGGNWFALTPSVTFQVKDNIHLTAVYEKIAYIVTVNIEGNGTVTGAEYPVDYGKEAELTAFPEEGYAFDGWEMNKKIVSKKQEYRFAVTGDVTVKAVFHEKPVATYKVTFQDINGDIIKTEFVKEGEKAAVPDVILSKPGRIFKGWGTKTDTPIYQNTVFTAQYEWEQILYTVEVQGGSFLDGNTEKQCRFDEKINVTALEEKEGEVFGYWKLNGEIVSYERESSFYVSGDMLLEAVYTENNTKQEPLVWMDEESIINNGNSKVTFLCKVQIPDNMKLMETGVVYTGKAAVAEQDAIVLGGSGTAKIASLSQSASGEFAISIKGIPKGKTVYAKTYLICQDENGNMFTIYTTDYVEATVK